MAYTILNGAHANASTITLGGTNSNSTYSVTSPVTAGSILTTNGATTANWGFTGITQPSSSAVHINEDGISMGEDADLTIGGQSLKEFMEGVSRRLAILIPDPELLEEFEALKQAYEHYKTLEALCVSGRKNDDQD